MAVTKIPAKLETRPNPSNHVLQEQNLQLQAGLVELHGCLHQVGGEVSGLRADVARVATEARDSRHAAANRHQKMEVQLALIRGKLGIVMPSDDQLAAGERPRGKSGLAGWSTPTAIIAMIGAAGGAQVLFKVVEPAVIAAAVAFHQALMGR